jgi:NADH:ubiquinone oxidoreductase subunit E
MFGQKPSHESVSLDVIWDLTEVLDERCPDGRMSTKDLQAIALELNVPLAHVYVAVGMYPHYQLEGEHGRGIRLCTGSCQAHGSLVLLGALLEKVSQGAELDITPVGCLDRCRQPIAVDLNTGEGQYTSATAGVDDTDMLLEALGCS